MTLKKNCTGHCNEFMHLSGEYNGLEKIFDLGIKYDKETESDEYGETPPGSGVKAYAEPLLKMYISVIPFEGGSKRTLHYGLTRSKWKNISSPIKQDEGNLLERAHNLIIEDLMALQKGQEPEALNKFRMV